jgi:hypothetical protein
VNTVARSECDEVKAAPGRRRAIRRALLIALILAGVALRAFIFIHLPRDLSVCTADFSALYAGGKLAGTADLYSPAAAMATEQQVAGCTMENLIFIRPPFYALLMRPFALLPFTSAFLLWRVLTLLAIGAFLVMWPGEKLVAAAACAWSVPLAATFTVGQDVAFVLAALLLGYRLFKDGHRFSAGLALGFCTIKFHLFLLLPLFLIRRKMWRTMLGGACVGTVFVLASFLVSGPHWIAVYRAALQDTRMNPYPWNMLNLNGLFHYNAPWVISCALAVAVIAWYFILRTPIEVSLPVVIAAGVLITPHNTVCDGLLFLPAFLLARHSRNLPARALSLFALTPLYAFLPPGALQVVVLTLMALGAWEISLSPSVELKR